MVTREAHQTPGKQKQLFARLLGRGYFKAQRAFVVLFVVGVGVGRARANTSARVS
jgi:hypothetical protein